MTQLTDTIIKKLLKAPVTLANGNYGVSHKVGKVEWRLEHDKAEQETFLCCWVDGYGCDVEIPESLLSMADKLEGVL